LKNKVKFLAIIPARKNSKTLKDKNIKLFNGKPLIYWTIKEALKSKYLSDIILSTDSEKIIKYCKKFKIKIPFKRPKDISLSKTPMLKVIEHVLENKEVRKQNYDAIVLLQPTSPLRIASDIDKACKVYMREKPDSLVTINQVNHTFNPESLFNKKGSFISKAFRIKKESIRQNKKKYFAPNGAAIYITSKKKISKFIIGGKKIIGILMPKERSIDIDDIIDFKIAEFLKKNEIN
jgi:CMP-N,N'-diacetyllegionaminic acid synthase|tara:strand:- start:3037 stop:3741 length:705 start_codon:yes stop_codon:yes gene_type:complete